MFSETNCNKKRPFSGRTQRLLSKPTPLSDEGSESTLSASDLDFSEGRGTCDASNGEEVPEKTDQICKKYLYNCSDCCKNFNNFYHYRYHLKKSHAVLEKDLPKKCPTNNKSFKCELCEKWFKMQKYLNEHMKRKHAETNYSNSKHKCPLCEENISKINVSKHLEETHDVSLNVEEITFPSLETFDDWRKVVEKETRSKFRNLGRKSSAGKKYLYYECHRSGDYVSKGKGQRHLRVLGSKKINHFCPASISAKINTDGHCKIKFVKNHLGHKQDIGPLPLSTSEREIIASKTASKLPFDTFFDEMRDSIMENQPERPPHVAEDSFGTLLSVPAEKELLIRQYGELIRSASERCELEVLKRNLKALKPAMQAAKNAASFH